MEGKVKDVDAEFIAKNKNLINEYQFLKTTLGKYQYTLDNKKQHYTSRKNELTIEKQHLEKTIETTKQEMNELKNLEMLLEKKANKNNKKYAKILESLEQSRDQKRKQYEIQVERIKSGLLDLKEQVKSSKTKEAQINRDIHSISTHASNVAEKHASSIIQTNQAITQRYVDKLHKYKARNNQWKEQCQRLGEIVQNQTTILQNYCDVHTKNASKFADMNDTLQSAIASKQ